ncbi:retrovirus-related pol polyprotein from transposon TNT 1-94 [Tanacetum coccineum]
MDENEVVIRNKARLVAQGYRQEEEIDYDETFTPVSKLKVIEIFLAYAAYMEFMVYQMDVKRMSNSLKKCMFNNHLVSLDKSKGTKTKTLRV